MTSKSKPEPELLPQRIVEPEKLYSFSAFQQIPGIGKAGLREARRNGLEVRYFGRQGYVLGKHFIEHVMAKGTTSRRCPN